MLCFDIVLLTVVCADVFCIPDIYVIIVVIFYFFLEPALTGLCPSGFQPPMANKYRCCNTNDLHEALLKKMVQCSGSDRELISASR